MGIQRVQRGLAPMDDMANVYPELRHTLAPKQSAPGDTIVMSTASPQPLTMHSLLDQAEAMGLTIPEYIAFESGESPAMAMASGAA